MTLLEIFAIFVMPGLTLAMAAAGYCIVKFTSQAKRPYLKTTDAPKAGTR